jgi:hypothetical protein
LLKVPDDGEAAAVLRRQASGDPKTTFQIGDGSELETIRKQN